jgi:hypothetical protein
MLTLAEDYMLPGQKIFLPEQFLVWLHYATIGTLFKIDLMISFVETPSASAS